MHAGKSSKSVSRKDNKHQPTVIVAADDRVHELKQTTEAVWKTFYCLQLLNASSLP